MARTVGLHGAGRIAVMHGLASKMLGMPVVSVASRTPSRAEECARQLGCRAVAYDHMPAGADIVVVATPPHRHAPDAIALLTRGAAVVVEKPLCTTLAEADSMVAAAATHGNRLLYGENLAYAAPVQAFLARARAIGPLTSLEARALYRRPELDGCTTRERGGGALFDLGSQSLAAVVLAAAPNKVVAVEASLSESDSPEADEHAEVRLHFDSGLQAALVSSWRYGPAPIWDIQASSATHVVRLELWPEPVLEHNGERVPLVTANDQAAPLANLGFAAQLAAFDRDLDLGREPMMSARFGRGILDIICAAYASAGSGNSEQTVPWNGPRDLMPVELWLGKRA